MPVGLSGFPTRLGVPHRQGWGLALISGPQGGYLGGAQWRLLGLSSADLGGSVSERCGVKRACVLTCICLRAGFLLRSI